MRIGDEHIGTKHGFTGYGFLHTQGTYFFNADEYTQYQGLHVKRGDTTRKLIDSFGLGEPQKIVSSTSKCTCIYEDVAVTFKLRRDELIVTTSHKHELPVTLDVRDLHEDDDQGRIYEVSRNEKTCVTYTKHSSNTKHHVQYKEALVFDGEGFVEQGVWVEQNYGYDASRNIASNFWIYVLGTFTVGPDTPLRIQFSNEASQPVYFPELRGDAGAVLRSYSGFLREHNGDTRVMAGYPWFLQPWKRDELVSLAPIIEHCPRLAWNILLTYYEDVALNTKPGSPLMSADTPGWLALRTEETLRELGDVPDDDLQRITTYFNQYLNRGDENGFIHNEAKETWMDTTGGTQDDRAGIRVEIQFGVLAIHSLLAYLSERSGEIPDTSHLAKQSKKVREHLLVGGVLRDGVTDEVVDMTTRPNVFLAWYLYPSALTKKEWMQTFDHVLDRCWLSWGGLSSIDTEHELFQPRHTGIDNLSYHRGDSWFYVNNVAAIAMQATSKDRYLKFVEKIKKASLNDFYYDFAVGGCSEISDAAEQNGKGCFHQAWSTATLYELLRRPS